MVIKFDEYLKENDGGGVAVATLGNTGGMGAVVAPQPSSIPGDVAGSTKGSGDIPSYDKGDNFDFSFKRKKKTKKKLKKSKNVNRFNDWLYQK